METSTCIKLKGNVYLNYFNDLLGDIQSYKIELKDISRELQSDFLEYIKEKKDSKNVHYKDKNYYINIKEKFKSKIKEEYENLLNIILESEFDIDNEKLSCEIKDQLYCIHNLYTNDLFIKIKNLKESILENFIKYENKLYDYFIKNKKIENLKKSIDYEKNNFIDFIKDNTDNLYNYLDNEIIENIKKDISDVK